MCMQLKLIGRRHDREVGQTAEIGEIERTLMRRAIGADIAGAVERKAYRKILHGTSCTT